jgi:hypothetical protein
MLANSAPCGGGEDVDGDDGVWMKAQDVVDLVQSVEALQEKVRVAHNQRSCAVAALRQQIICVEEMAKYAKDLEDTVEVMEHQIAILENRRLQDESAMEQGYKQREELIAAAKQLQWRCGEIEDERDQMAKSIRRLLNSGVGLDGISSKRCSSCKKDNLQAAIDELAEENRVLRSRWCKERAAAESNASELRRINIQMCEMKREVDRDRALLNDLRHLQGLRGGSAKNSPLSLPRSPKPAQILPAPEDFDLDVDGMVTPRVVTSARMHQWKLLARHKLMARSGHGAQVAPSPETPSALPPSSPADPSKVVIIPNAEDRRRRNLAPSSSAPTV